MDYTVYLSNSEAFASVVTEGLLEVIPGVVRSDLQELTITSAQTAKFAKKVTKDLHPSNLRNGEEEGLKPLDMYTAAEEPAILVKLTLTFTAPGASYIQVAGQLFAADEAHFFDHALRKSAARYNISALSSVMSTILSVAEVTATITPSTEVNEQNVENVDAAAIVGGVLGGALFLLLVAVIGYMYWRSTTSGGRSILPIADPVSGGDPLGDIFCEVLPQPSAPPLPRRN